MEEMYSIRKTAKMLGVTTYTVRNWARNKKIKAVKIPNTARSQWFISAEEISRLKNGDVNNENKEKE